MIFILCVISSELMKDVDILQDGGDFVIQPNPRLSISSQDNSLNQKRKRGNDSNNGRSYKTKVCLYVCTTVLFFLT